MDERRLFSAADEEAIRAAVADAEQRSAGEVVPWIVEACDPYPEAGWKAAALGATHVIFLAADTKGIFNRGNASARAYRCDAKPS